MKFLCGSCKAKYQIADEKISGRTLRMKCRRCGHDIVIRGDEELPRSAPRPAAAPRTGAGGSVAGPMPRRSPQPRGRASSALGADFRRQVAGGGHDMPQRAGALEHWHVAVNDVPVGPVRRDEIARKVATGAVNGESLVWREGFDDWRPLKDVPELAAVLRQRSSLPGGRPMPPRPPPPRPGARARPRPAGRTTSSGAFAPPRRDSEAARVAARSNVVPIGGRLGASAAPAFEEPPEDDEATRVSDPLFDDFDTVGGAPAGAGAMGYADEVGPTLPDEGMGAGAFMPQPHVSMAPAAEPARIRRAGMPVGAWIAIAGAGAFGMMLAAMVGTKLLTDSPQVAQQTVAEPVPGAAEPEVATPEIVAEEQPLGQEPEPEEGDPGAEAGSASGPRSPRQGTAPATQMTTSMNLSAEDRALMERFGQQAGTATAANIRVGSEPAAGAAGATGVGLNARQLGDTVGRNRPSLRRCYETAVRGMGDPPTVRMDVDVTVGSTGVVTRVHVRGSDLGSLATCVESAVRRWRFPASGNSTQTSFPVVFQPGA